MDLGTELAGLLDRSRVLTRQIDRIAYANDASVYRLVPRAVVLPRSTDEIGALFRFSRARRIPLTFRTAGTSLSGQAVTDGILVVLSRHWRGMKIEDDGRRVRVQPGVIGGVVNQHLAPMGRKIGPDPASINACMMGGILANNSSGMCCGVSQNAYRTLRSMRFVLPNGLDLDSADPGAEARLAREAPELTAGLLGLKRRIEADPVLSDRIRSKYRLKNTMGYSLNALLDFDTPLSILTHLMIGSEGTLGMIAEAVLDTVPDYPCKSTGLLFFPDVPRACASIQPLTESGARALELMDHASLRAIREQPGVPEGIDGLPDGAAAILVEYQCSDEKELAGHESAFDRLLPSLPFLGEAGLTRDPDHQAALWTVRKGLIPSVGAMRRRGTSFIIEDIVFPGEHLAAGVTELQRLFVERGYDDAIVFGHARDGNLHFVLTQAFDDPTDVERYDAFMVDLADLVATRYGGSLKAEHGTGRNMAPFVAREWGGEAYAAMREIKRLVDPDGLLNPGVLINDDPRAHVTHLKDLPEVEAEVDACIECGFCERVCPSRDLTLTPRQRIVVRREMARLRQLDPLGAALRELKADYRFEAVDSCAADGLCALSCPVDIDTGRLVRRLRAERHSAPAAELVRYAAARFGHLESLCRGVLGTGHALRRLLGDRRLAALSERLSSLLGGGIPTWQSDLPRPASGTLPGTRRNGAAAVYFPSCVSRILGRSAGDDESAAVTRRLVEVAERAGRPVWIPDDVSGHCCGMPFGSKGFVAARREAVSATVTALWRWSDHGALPIVIDSSPCARTLRQAGPDLRSTQRDRYDRMTILDGIEFADSALLPNLSLRSLDGSVALHPTCSTRKMGLEGALQRIAEACAEGAFTPVTADCCGFAGDRGFALPSLTAAATRSEAEEIRDRDFVGHYSSSRTCEIGLSRATGRPYHSFWSLLERASRPESD